MRLGIHTSTSGSLQKAALQAAELGANTFQIFSASPRMWRARMPDAEPIRLLSAARQRFDLNPLVIHANYLINLASQDVTIRARSIDGFRGELQRAAAIGAEYLVVHPGSYRGQSVTEGVAAVALGLRDAAMGLDLGGLMVLLENTAGSGCVLGSCFEELGAIRELSPLPVGFCFDTCHLLAAGFDIVTRRGLSETLHRAEVTLGLDSVRVIHANDSKMPLGSRVDRHANIGEGFIGIAAFRRMLTHPDLRGKPFILETPVDQPGDDRRNLNILKELAARRRTTALGV